MSCVFATEPRSCWRARAALGGVPISKLFYLQLLRMSTFHSGHEHLCLVPLMNVASAQSHSGTDKIMDARTLGASREVVLWGRPACFVLVLSLLLFFTFFVVRLFFQPLVVGFLFLVIPLPHPHFPRLSHPPPFPFLLFFIQPLSRRTRHCFAILAPPRPLSPLSDVAVLGRLLPVLLLLLPFFFLLLNLFLPLPPPLTSSSSSDIIDILRAISFDPIARLS